MSTAIAFEGPATPCPVCEKLLNAAATIDEHERPPVTGDTTICCHCSAILVFTETLGLRLITDEEWNALPLEDRRELHALGLLFKQEAH